MEEAMEYARRTARFNKIELPEDFTINPPIAQREEQMDTEESTIRKVLTILTTKKVTRKRAICMFYIWWVEGSFVVMREWQDKKKCKDGKVNWECKYMIKSD